MKQSAIIDKKYYEFEMDEALTVGNGFVFDGDKFGITGIISDQENKSQLMLTMKLTG